MGQTIGIPRAMLFYRYETIWTRFFAEMGAQVVVSGPTTQSVVDKGASLAIDEACLSLKIFLGHVYSLVGYCDHIFVPRVSNFGKNREMCARFEALYDVTRSMLRKTDINVLTYNVDLNDNKGEEEAFVRLGQALGSNVKRAKKAYAAAKKEEQAQLKADLQKQAALLEGDGLKILIAAHSYVIEDAYTGKPIKDFLLKNGATPIRGDVVERDAALKRSVELSRTCKWEMNRELMGGINMYKDKADGIILLSTFPCGPDSMANDLIIRRVEGIPILNLVLDGQSGTAGLETRLESFLDIIRFKRGELR